MNNQKHYSIDQNDEIVILSKAISKLLKLYLFITFSLIQNAIYISILGYSISKYNKIYLLLI